MSTTRIRIDPDNPATLPEGRSTFDPAVVDGTTESEIAMQQQEDDAEAMQDMARYDRAGFGGDWGSIRRSWRVASMCRRKRSVTGSRGEQGKRCPTATAYALLWVLDKAPGAALRVLT